MAFVSDWTVAPATPLKGIYAAVNPGGRVPEQKIPPEKLRHARVEATVAGGKVVFRR